MTLRKHMDFSFVALDEGKPGAVWQHQFELRWTAYKRWFLRYGEKNRPTYLESSKALSRHMPEMVATYEAMVDLAGGGDHAARFLAQYCPPPLFRGCSQAVYIADEATMVRSYDYSPYVFDGLLMRTRFDQREVIAMLDCMSGVLDGINSDGLAVSMSFGGREEFGEGFGIPLVLRYLLEYAGNVKEASEMVKRIPVHGAYNIMLLDRDAKFETLAVSAGGKMRKLPGAVATNHQPGSNWPLYEEKVKTHLRYQQLSEMVAGGYYTASDFARQFLQPPLYQTQFGRGFGTLYNAAFYPQRKSCEYLWPHQVWAMDFDNFFPREYHIAFTDPAGYPKKSQSYGEIYTAKPLPIMRF